MSESSEFSNVRSHGISRAGRFVVIATLPDESLSYSKLGFITSKKVGKAVTRNLIRRRLRSIVQRNGDFFAEGNRYVVTIARWNAKNASFTELERDWVKVARKLGIFPNDYQISP